MLLSDKLLAEIVGAEVASPSYGGVERRRTRRFAMNTAVAVMRLENGKTGPAMVATTQDISTAGICILLPTPIHVGEQFVVVLPRTEGAPVCIRCTAYRWYPVNRDSYQVGAEFDSVLEAQEDKPLEHPDEAMRRIQQAVLA